MSSKSLPTLRQLVFPKLLHYVLLSHPSQKLNRTGRGAANFRLFPPFLPSPHSSPWVFVLCPKSVLFFPLLSSGSQEYGTQLEEITSYYGNTLLLRQLTTYVSACTHSLDCYAILGQREGLDAVFTLFFKFHVLWKKGKPCHFSFCKVMRIREYFLFSLHDLTWLWKLHINSQQDFDIVKPEQCLKSKSKI